MTSRFRRISFVWLMFCISSLGFSQMNAGEYMSDLSTPVTELKSETWHYLKAVTGGKSVRKVDNKRQKLIKSIQEVKQELSTKKPFEGDNSYRKALIDYLNVHYLVMKQDYDKILNMEEIAEQSYDLMEAYLLAQEQAGDKLDEASDNLSLAENEFAKNHSVNLIEGDNSDKTVQKIKKASATLKYYNVVYLTFFKCYKQELYVLDAQNKGDINALEQNNNTLKMYAEECMQKLKSLESYNGDASLKNTAIKVVSFYKNESEEAFPLSVDFLINKDSFDKTRKSFESKSEKKRTQQDVDQYNAALEKYNGSIPAYNSSLQKSNEKRSQLLEDWNNTVSEFFNEHSK